MSFIWYLLWFLVAVSLLVTVHEFGHYWVARRFDIKVLRFSVGFGRPIYKRVAGADRTEYVIAAIPLGGYVKMLDEREGPVEPAERARSFTGKPPWQRIAVLLAGPGFNIAFAILVLWGMRWAGGITEYKPLIGDVAAGSIAAHAGLHPNEVIVAIDGEPVAGQRDVIFGLLDAISGNGAAVLTVRAADGAVHTATLAVADSEARRRLTEPEELFKGLGFEFWEPAIPAVLGQVTPDGPAARAGLKPGDTIVAVNDTPIHDFRDVITSISDRPGASVVVQYRRAGVVASTRVTVGSEVVDGHRIGRMLAARQDIAPKYPDSMFLHTDLTPVAALGHAANEAWSLTVLQGRLTWRMLRGQVSLKNLNGPVSIAQFAGESAEAGVTPFLGFLVLISLSLGFLNLLPVPILDGGQIVFQAVEWLKGSPLSDRAQIFGQQLGIVLLLLLMGVALFNDLARQFG